VVGRDLGADDTARGAVVEVGVDLALAKAAGETRRAPQVERHRTVQDEGARSRVRPRLVLLAVRDRLLAVAVLDRQAGLAVRVEIRALTRRGREDGGEIPEVGGRTARLEVERR